MTKLFPSTSIAIERKWSNGAVNSHTAALSKTRILYLAEPRSGIPYYVKLVGIPGTLAGDILRLKSDLPRYNCHLEIIGNDVRKVERENHGCMTRLTLTSRIAARKLPSYPPSHSTPKNISKSAQHTNKKSDTRCSAVVLPASFSCWEGRKKAPSFSPSSSDPSWKPFCLIKTKGGSKISGDGWSKSSTVSHTCTRSESYTATLPCETFSNQIRLSSATSSVFILPIIANHLRSMAAIIAISLSPAMSLLLARCCGSPASIMSHIAEMFSSTIHLRLRFAISLSYRDWR